MAWEIIAGEDWQMIGWSSGFEIILMISKPEVENGHREAMDGHESLGKT